MLHPSIKHGQEPPLNGVTPREANQRCLPAPVFQAYFVLPASTKKRRGLIPGDSRLDVSSKLVVSCDHQGKGPWLGGLEGCSTATNHSHLQPSSPTAESAPEVEFFRGVNARPDISREIGWVHDLFHPLRTRGRVKPPRADMSHPWDAHDNEEGRDPVGRDEPCPSRQEGQSLGTEATPGAVSSNEPPRETTMEPQGPAHFYSSTC
jgi:hypothetical protein